MLEEMSAFCAVAELKSFSQAARRLNLSAAVITRRVAKLESSLSARLLNRTTRQVLLTEAGQIFYAQVRDVLQTLETSKKMIKSFNQEITGTLKIGLPASISYLHVTPALPKFINQYPHLKIQIIQGNHLLDLLSNGFDLVIHCGKLPDSNFYYKKLGEWKKITCASQAYLKKHGTPKTPKDLLKHQCVDHYDNQEHTWSYSTGEKVTEILINARLYSNSSLDLKNFAQQGLGIAYLPSFTVQQELQSKQLLTLLKNYQLPALNIYAVYPSHQYLSKKTKIFIEFLEKLLSQILVV